MPLPAYRKGVVVVVSRVKEMLPGVPQSEPLLIAADASLRGVLVTGAYVSSWGHWGLLCHRQGDSIWLRDTSSTAELWALCDGTYSVMKTVRKDGKQPPLILHCDNTAVVKWVELWTQGSRKMPNVPIKGQKKPYLYNARDTIQSWSAPISVVHTPRKQNKLQDACDQLARIAYDLNAYIISQAKAVVQVEAIVKRALA